MNPHSANLLHTMTMDHTELLFERMDAWRHFPAYQLERRADILFSLYLSEVLQEKLGFPVQQDLLPEFPVRIGSIDQESNSDQSYKIDYLALSEDGTRAVLVELKTDTSSRRVSQNNYLNAAKQAGLTKLLEGVLMLFKATKSKHKYFSYLLQLESMGLLSVPLKLKQLMLRPSLDGVNDAAEAIEITAHAQSTVVVFVQPTGSRGNIITFDEFSNVVYRYTDPLSRRFAASLERWANTPATQPVLRAFSRA